MAGNLGARRDGIDGAKVRKMRDAAKRTLGWMLVVAVVAAVVIVVSGEKDEPAPAPVPTAEETGTPANEAETESEQATSGGQKKTGKEPGGGGPRPKREGRSGREIIEQRIAREAERTYRAYVAAIDARDGEALCRLIAPGFLAELDPKVRRDDCAATMHAAIGYADPRGYPVWEETILTGFERVTPAARTGEAQVTASVITRFSDRTEPSIESDIAYLGPIAGEMRLLKASGILWRAVGKPDYPPKVITPP